MMKRLLRFLIAVLFFLNVSPVWASDSPLVRVAVLREAKNLKLSVQGPFTFNNAQTGEVVHKSQRIHAAKVEPVTGGISVDGREYTVLKLQIDPQRDATIEINNRRFRGKITIINDKGLLTAVNLINVEDYVKGVLYHEVSHRWPMESLKAQAVAARTYALYTAGLNRSRDYDLTNDIFSQVYGGRNSERYRTGIAVDSTEGLVLAYEGKIIPAYFHATCAGKTENAANLWNIDIVPLRSVNCPYCKDSPHFNWKRNFRLKDVQEALNAKGYKIGLIKEVSVAQRNNTGRIKKLKITSRDGKTLLIDGKDFRGIIGPNIVRSNNYTPVMQGYYMDLVGNGWGHGVGLCQWGARAMASERLSYRQILRHYYPQVEIVPFDSL